jgi:hypothetical protein
LLLQGVARRPAGKQGPTVVDGDEPVRRRAERRHLDIGAVILFGAAVLALGLVHQPDLQIG